jgi:hypothetical protein
MRILVMRCSGWLRPTLQQVKHLLSRSAAETF